MEESGAGRGSSSLCYLLVVEGHLPPEWHEWFGAESVRRDEKTSLIDLRVRDQAELHGILRRVHDLHLRLVSLTRVSPDSDHREDR